MADEYTPEMKKIRADYITLHTRSFDEYTVGRSLTSEQEFYGDRFDDALAAHDRAVKAEVLREVEDALETVDRELDAVFWDGRGYEFVTDWLRARADEMEAGT